LHDDAKNASKEVASRRFSDLDLEHQPVRFDFNSNRLILPRIMFSKPFKTPLIRKQPIHTSSTIHDLPAERPAKRRRISDDEDDYLSDKDEKDAVSKPTYSTSQKAIQQRAPLHIIRNPPSPERSHKPDTSSGDADGYYNVLWRKPSGKKHKTWDSDGILVIKGGFAILQDVSGADLGRTKFSGTLLPGSNLSVGGKEIEVESMLDKKEYLAGRMFLGARKHAPQPAVVPMKDISRQPLVAPPKKLSLQAQMKAEIAKKKDAGKKANPNTAAPLSRASQTGFKNPMKDSAILPQIPSEKPIPMFNPKAEGALVFARPKSAPKGRQIVDVVLDPRLSGLLRPHQREGVKFLYECVMGLRDYDGQGCLLADDMGLGKTLQTICLLWTLLKQNPIHKSDPVIKKALIVCPVTLIDNWRKEFRKWLGNDRIGVFVVDGPKTRLSDFTHGKIYNVMIIGYERLKSVAEDLTKGAGVDIVIADEGHRLKTVQNKSAKAIQSLNATKRVILSGTPIQNDLSEFFSMINFVNDGCLGTYKSFMKNFETPIVKSRQPNALEKDVELGEARSEELAQLTSAFILRRTADILSKYLPSKTEYVLFCNPTPEQANIYKQVLGTPMFSTALGNSDSALQLITILKKLCNSPSLLRQTSDDDDASTSSSLSALLEMLPPGTTRNFHNQASTKIRVLDQLLHSIRTLTDEKVVLVSNYTSTLTVLSQLLTANGLPYLRLDGSTPASKRQGLVDDFNRSTAKNCFAFLLSAKAGGLGLNLIGGSRLVLFDVDWNPATDDQAMARIHREGQKRDCKIYRFLVKGALEERIWQRQVVKRGLADSVMDLGGGGKGGGGGGGKKGVAAFSREELRDLFRLDEREGLRTHELIGCPCEGSGMTTGNAAKDEVVKDIDEIDDDSDDESLASLDFTQLTKASKLSAAKMDEDEVKIASGRHPKRANAGKQQEQEMQALMEYAHLDTAGVAGLHENSEALARMEEVVDDDCLMQALREGGQGQQGRVAFIFKKMSESKKEQVLDGGEVVEGKEEVVRSGFFQ
jgi:DNA repair and recombination protein RAD54B